MSQLPDGYSIDKEGVINVKQDINFSPIMKKKRVVKAVEEYIECPCGNDMRFINMLNHVFLWECIACKKRTATIYNILSPLIKVTNND
jgi:hypothetical protein